MRKHALFFFVLALFSGAFIATSNSGCVPHAEERGENALIAARYQIALEKCVDKAIASLADGGNRDVAGDIYVACAEKADAASGRVK